MIFRINHFIFCKDPKFFPILDAFKYHEPYFFTYKYNFEAAWILIYY